jgi:hypothetical protein
VQELPEAGDDEERVVDPDAEADHRYEQRRDRVDVGEAGEDEEQEERARERGQRKRDRERRRHEGAEDDDQHDERREQAEQLLCPLLDGRELRRLEPRDGLLDGRATLRSIELFALRRREHDVQHAALLGRELRLDQVCRFLGIRPRNLELVTQLTPDRPDQDDQGGDDADPAEDDSPRMCRARSRPAREGAGREPFVGCTPLQPTLVLGSTDPAVFVRSARALSHVLPLRRCRFSVETG